MKFSNQLKIAIIDDSVFYNRLVTHQLKNYVKALEIDYGFGFEIQSYTDAKEFENNLTSNLDFVFTDYFLGDHKTAKDIIALTQSNCNACTVVVISQIRNTETSIDTLEQGAAKFILKDKKTLEKTCFFLTDFLTKPSLA